jgi:hypothetical protein
MEEEVMNVLALSYDGGRGFYIKGIDYSDLSYHDTYLSIDDNIIFRKEVDGDVPVIDLQSIQEGEVYNLIDLI